MTELSRYALELLRKGSEFALYRGMASGLAPILIVPPVREQASVEMLRRLEHEFALRAELDAAGLRGRSCS